MRTPSLLIASLLVACAGVGGGCPANTGGEGEEGEGAAGEGEGAAASDIVLDSTETLDVPDISLANDIALAVRGDGRVAIAYTNNRHDGASTNCTLVLGTKQTTVLNQDVVVSDEQADGTFTTRTVDTVPQQFGDSVAISVDPTNDSLVVAYQGGGVAQSVCQSTDLEEVVETGGVLGAPIQLAAGSADDGTLCRTEQSVCANGDVVGIFPSVAHDSTGAHWAIGYQDLHFGIGADDIEGSDIAVVTGGAAVGGTDNMVSGDDGAAYHENVAVTEDGLTLIGHEINSSNQLESVAGDPNSPPVTIHAGVYMEAQQTDGTYVETDVFQNGSVDDRVSVATSSDGLFGAFRETGTKQLILVRSVDGGLTWTPDFVERVALTGFSPKLGFLSDGSLIVAYGHCNDNGESSTGCDSNQDGVRIAWKDSVSDAKFNRKTFTGEAEDLEGLRTDMVIGADDVINVISFNASRTQIVVQRFHKVAL